MNQTPDCHKKPKLTVIKNPNPKYIKPYTIIDKVGIGKFQRALYVFLYNLEIVCDEKEFIDFSAANKDLIKWFLFTQVESKPYLKVIKGGAAL